MILFILILKFFGVIFSFFNELITNGVPNDNMYTSLLIFLSILLIIVALISASLNILKLIGLIGIFRKAGKPIWRAFIPFVNSYTYFQIIYGEGWKFLFLFVPFLDIITNIMVLIRLPQVFGEKDYYSVLNFFFPRITHLVIGFDKSSYIGPIKSFL